MNFFCINYILCSKKMSEKDDDHKETEKSKTPDYAKIAEERRLSFQKREKETETIKKQASKWRSYNKRRRSNCSARILPYYVDEKNNIFLVMVTVRKYDDWTALGGRCSEIVGDCPSKMIKNLRQCLVRELEEESHMA